MELDKSFKLFLASGSPRRRELLGFTGMNFEILPPDIEEISELVEPSEVAKDLAEQKGMAVLNQLEANSELPFVVASDTLVALDGIIYGKPKGKEEAREILTSLSGRTHKVCSGVFFGFKLPDGTIKSYSFTESTMVEFEKITDEIMDIYLETGDSLDKAGAYGIQKAGLLFVKSLQGSYSNVVGFPLSRFIVELKDFLLELGLSDDWRSYFAK